MASDYIAETPRLIFLDFDGVILESNEAKATAYRELFRDYPDRLDEILALYRAHAGIHRTVILRHIVGDVLSETPTEDRIRTLAEQLAEIVVVHVQACSEVNGLRDLLQTFPGRCYVVSGAPEEEVRSALERRGLSRFFVDIFGAPKAKIEVLLGVLATTGVSATDTVFVGDSVHDYRAATGAGVPFVARISMDRDLRSSPGWPRVNSLDELLGFLLSRRAPV